MSELQAALSSASSDRERNRLSQALYERSLALVAARDESALLELRGWAWQHPLFMTPKARLRGFLARWEEALLAFASLPVAASLVRDDVATAVCDPWDRLAARASWAELRPLLREDEAAWCVAEARVLHGEPLRGRSPFSGMPLQRFRWEPALELTHYSPTGSSWSSQGFTSPLTPIELPPPRECLACEPEWGHLLAVWDSWRTARVVKVAGTGPEALAALLGPREAATTSPEDALLFGECTWKEALAAMLRMHGNSVPYTDGRGMVAARRAVWRLLAALAGTGWPVSGSRLQAAMKGWRWARYDPREPDAEADDWSLFLVLADPRRNLAWATFAWVTD